ncbi:MAG: DNA repair protein RadA [Clostridiales bacterium]|nr:DNA repair protein RadA [Clostridiales bacterium]
MAKNRTSYVCSECGYEHPKWYGKCPACSSFGTMNEEVVLPEGPGRAAVRRPAEATLLMEEGEERGDEIRLSTGMGELDRVFGGGVVRGSVTLLGGDPGIGKSTILLQACRRLSQSSRVLYVTGEESRRQIRLRAKRLGLEYQPVLLLTNTELSAVEQVIERESPDVVVIDSIQTLYSAELSALPGAIGQIRDCTNRLIALAKTREITFLLVGHINKEGSIAGPKMLEHMVDTVLYFEGDQNLTYRIIRAAKNRFGSTNEIGIFEMGEQGLLEVENPSAALISDRPRHVPGSCIVCVMEGTRPLLAEVQALLSDSSYGTPRRMSTGIDGNRVAMLLAVLEKRAGLRLSGADAYCNVVGGLRLIEPASDLAVVLAAASSHWYRPVEEDLIVFGEVGLSGELRSVRNAAARIAECERLGYSRFLIPGADRPKTVGPGTTVYAVKNIVEAIEVALQPKGVRT